MNKREKSFLLQKINGIFCGEEIIKTGFNLLNANVEVRFKVRMVKAIEIGQAFATVSGKVSDLLKGERVVLKSCPKNERDCYAKQMKQFKH